MRRLLLTSSLLALAGAALATAQTTLNLGLGVTVTLARNWDDSMDTDVDSFVPDVPVQDSQGSRVESGVNKVLNPAICDSPARASWCTGSDIGAWTNAAIAALLNHCGEIYIPAGTYTQTTTIGPVPRCVHLRGASAYGTVLNYTPTTGWAMILADSTASGAFGPAGSVEDLTLQGPGPSSTTGGIYIGGSDGGSTSPSTSIDPGTNYGDHMGIDRVRVGAIKGFGVGVQWGENAWRNNINRCVISFNGTGLFFPTALPNSGENISLTNDSINNNTGIGLKIASGTVDTDFHVTDSSFDYNRSWAIQNGTSLSGAPAVYLIGGHVEQTSNWVQNFGYFSAVATMFTNGSDSGKLGWLIDNEAQNFTAVGGTYLNAGTGAILKPSGICSTWLGVTANTAITNACTQIDRFGDISLAGTGAAKLWTSNQGAEQTAGNVSLGAGWGNGATVTEVTGYSQTEQFTITSGSGGFSSAPTVTVKFPTAFSSPQVCTLDTHGVAGGGGFILFKNTSRSPTASVFTATNSSGGAYTPAASEVYTVVMRCGP